MAREEGKAKVEGTGNPQVAEDQKFPKFDPRIALWLSLFILGGGLLALYYSGIHYFPVVSWQDALTYLALMTIIGGSLLVAYSFLLFVPGAIWSKFLIFDKPLHPLFEMGGRSSEPCAWLITKRILLPFSVYMAFCHFLLYQEIPGWFVPLGALASLAAVSILLGRDLREQLRSAELRKARGVPPQGHKDTRKLRQHRSSMAFFHIPLLIAFIFKAWTPPCVIPREALWLAALCPLVSIAWLNNSRIRRKRWFAADKWWSLLCRAILAFSCAAFLSLVALWLFYRIYTGGVSGNLKEIPLNLFFLCTFVVIVANLIVSLLFHEPRHRALLASFVAALVLLGAGPILGMKPEVALPAKIMERFGFGGEQGTLVLTEKGGRILCQHGVPVEFEKQERPNFSEKDSSQAGASSEAHGEGDKAAEKKPEHVLARSVGLRVLSRLGSEYFLGYQKDGFENKIALPRDEVMSWSTGSEKPIRTNDCAPNSADTPATIGPKVN